VRVFFYRQHKPDGTVVEAYWMTNFPSSTVSPQALFRMAKSRWEIESQSFNNAKSRHSLEHICQHHANSLQVGWILTPWPSNDSTASCSSTVANIRCRAAPSCCCFCGSVFPAGLPPMAVEV
jgi:hypothetical protein